MYSDDLRQRCGCSLTHSLHINVKHYQFCSHSMNTNKGLTTIEHYVNQNLKCRISSKKFCNVKYNLKIDFNKHAVS